MRVFDDIRRDREAGTPGPWESVDFQIWRTLGDEPKDAYYYIDCLCDVRSNSGWPKYKKFPVFANASRIARVPELERIALAAEELAQVFPDIVGYLEGLIEDGCPKCGGDCSGANPPVSYCPMKSMSNDLARANAALAKLREASK